MKRRRKRPHQFAEIYSACRREEKYDFRTVERVFAIDEFHIQTELDDFFAADIHGFRLFCEARFVKFGIFRRGDTHYAF